MLGDYFLTRREVTAVYSTGGAQTIVLDDFPIDPTIFAGGLLRLGGALITNAGTTTLKLYKGGTRGAVDGTLIYASPALTGAQIPFELEVPAHGLTALERLKLVWVTTGAATINEFYMQFYAPAVVLDPDLGGLPPVAESDDQGVDFDILDDLRPSFILARGQRNIALAIARRLSTPRGALAAIGDDPDYGLNLRGYLNLDLTTSQLAAIEGDVESEVLKDERIQGADVDVTFIGTTGTLTVDIDLETIDGPFRLILGVTERFVEVLNEGLALG